MIEGRHLPPLQTILATIDQGARDSFAEVRPVIGEIVDEETPRHSGTLDRALQPRLTRTATGAGLLIAAARGQRESGGAALNEVLRWVQRGTGLYREGPGPKRRIRAKNPLRRMSLYGVHRWDVRGQHADPFMERIRSSATPHIEAAAEKGAERTARALERLTSR